MEKWIKAYGESGAQHFVLLHNRGTNDDRRRPEFLIHWDGNLKIAALIRYFFGFLVKAEPFSWEYFKTYYCGVFNSLDEIEREKYMLMIKASRSNDSWKENMEMMHNLISKNDKSEFLLQLPENKKFYLLVESNPPPHQMFLLY